MKYSSALEAGKAICEALDLDPRTVRGLHIHLVPGDVPSITVEYLPSARDGRLPDQLEATFRKFHLEPIEEEDA